MKCRVAATAHVIRDVHCRSDAASPAQRWGKRWLDSGFSAKHKTLWRAAISPLFSRKGQNLNWSEEKWHRPSGICNKHVRLTTPGRDSQGGQESYRVVQSHSEKLTVRSENYWRELVHQSHSKWKGASFNKDGLLSDSLDISTDSGKRDQAVRNREQTGPPQFFSGSLWAASEHDR